MGVSLKCLVTSIVKMLTSFREYESILSLSSLGGTVTPSAILSRTRRDFAQDLYDSCMRSERTAGRPFCSQNATWFSVLRAAMRHTGVKAMTKDQWIGALTVAMLACRIECMPGSYQSKLSCRRATRLVGSAPAALAIAARPGSLKRAAIEAEHRARHRPPRKSGIDFGCTVPFDTIPQLVEDGFRQHEKVFRTGNQGILEHYQTARQCLAECLGDPLCDVMLMMVLTLASSSVTPTVAPKAQAFSAGPKKDSSMFAASLVTRMLWFLRPGAFPWDVNDSAILRVPDMTRKIGKLAKEISAYG